MDLKRNYCSNIQPPTQIKANPLLNPLITISNASTPVRTRIVKPGSQLNSTPVNVHKIGAPIRSPVLSNKQNDQGNCKLAFKKVQLPKHNINLSPIMALNRKMSEGPKLQQRSFTPTGFKRQESMANIHENNENQGQQIQTAASGFGQALKQSKSSNGFKNMLQSRSKTPTRTAFAETLQRQSSQGNVLTGLRASGSANSLLQGISPKMRDSKCVKLGESRSFEQLINMGTPVAKENEILCSNSNEHQKKVKAKYKVVEQPDDQDILVYCSKCAINLVQKGFKVEDLTPEDIQHLKRRQSQQFYQKQNQNHYSNQYFDYAQQTNRKIKLKLNQLVSQKQNLVTSYNKEIDDVQCYYNSILSMVEQQKRRDKQVILAFLQKEKRPGQYLERKIKDAHHQLEHMIKNGHISHQQFNKIQQIQSLLTQKGFNYRADSSHHLSDNIQFKFDHFSRFFNNEGKLRIEDQDKQYGFQSNNILKKQYFSNKETKQASDCPLRFSFEKKLKETKKSPIGYRVDMMNPLEEASQAMEGEDSNQYSNEYETKEKKAFRTLFPEDEESEQQTEKQAIHSPTFKQI